MLSKQKQKIYQPSDSKAETYASHIKPSIWHDPPTVPVHLRVIITKNSTRSITYEPMETLHSHAIFWNEVNAGQTDAQTQKWMDRRQTINLCLLL